MESLKLTKGKILMICFALLPIALIAVMVFKVSLGNLLFFAVIAACPLMHIFMMKDHGVHKETDGTKSSGKRCH